MAVPDEAAMDDDDGGMEDAPDLGDLDLHTRGLVKRYGGRRVVDGVSIGLSRGEVVGLLGPNGAGKTTSFYMVVGLIQPNEGHVYLDGHDITRLRMHRRARRGIGYLAQSSSVFRKLSVWDNIMAILELQPLSKTERLQRCEDLLERLKVGHLRASMGESLSGGERRRVEIARCLASDPSFILLDEPFTGVDPRAIQDIQDIVSELKEDGIGILITDHSFRETLEITDRAYIIFDGKLQTHGTPAELVHDEAAQRLYFGDALTRGLRIGGTEV
ncbi:MAG: LPS export ABC transporter ATP-binding protein [candidate division WS1 bacterium]|nr:LPS export ABC transporter ATP-binding protein [candidate division WS1 bacterium]